MQLYIVARTSTDMQNPKSPEDQVREVRSGLDRLGIDHSNAIVMMAQGESGMSDDRECFREIESRIQYGEALMLAVDDQSRFSRGMNVRGLITDLVYNGGRFISTGEMIDSEQEGWESRVFLNEMHHSQSSRDTGRRVRRGVWQGSNVGREQRRRRSNSLPANLILLLGPLLFVTMRRRLYRRS